MIFKLWCDTVEVEVEDGKTFDVKIPIPIKLIEHGPIDEFIPENLEFILRNIDNFYQVDEKALKDNVVALTNRILEVMNELK